jgi:hypothetical protein
MGKFFITEEEKSNILKMYLLEDGSQHTLLSEAPTVYDPWAEHGAPLPNGLKFKSPEAYNALSTPPMGVQITSADQAGAPSLFAQDPTTKQFKLKTPQTSGGQRDLNAEIDIIAQNLFVMAAALGLKGLSPLSDVNSLGGYYKRVMNSVSKLVPPTNSILSPAGVALIMPTDKRYVDIVRSWTYLVNKKYDPIYKSRISQYAVLPAQK